MEKKSPLYASAHLPRHQLYRAMGIKRTAAEARRDAAPGKGAYKGGFARKDREKAVKVELVYYHSFIDRRIL